MNNLNLNKNPYTNTNEFINQAINASLELPLDIRKLLYNFKQYSNNEGYLLFKNISRESNLIQTPYGHDDIKYKKNYVSESTLAIFGSYLGYLYSYRQESNGNIFNNIRPTAINEKIQSSESSDVLLELHKEIAFHEISPDFILLYCLREDRTAKALTGVASIRNALKLLDETSIIELRKPHFLIGVDYSFSQSKGKDHDKKISILNGPLDDPYLIYDADLIKPINAQAENAMQKLDQALRKVMSWISMKSGDLLIIDNNKSVHSRTAFQAFYDGYDRWLQRCFIKKCKVSSEVLLNRTLEIVDIDYSYK